MAESKKRNTGRSGKYFSIFFIFGILVLIALNVSSAFSINLFPLQYQLGQGTERVKSDVEKIKDFILPAQPLDKNLYDQKLIALANNPIVATSSASSTPPKYLWPAKPTVYPLTGALLPFNRIVAYYGNFYSKAMGVLGQYPPEEMISKLRAEALRWQAADPVTPVIPAIHYIAVTAQGSAGSDGRYRLRMPADQIEKAIALAEQVHGLVFLDIQVGLSNVQSEIPLLAEFLKLPNVHLGLDPEFSMKTGAKPGTVIGTMDATDINFAASYLATLVKENSLPPKILVIHRFTENMVTNYKAIKPLPEVQIVMDMDGWGPQAKKMGTYKQVIYPEPIQFTGFKLFYKNDVLDPGTTMLTPTQVLGLRPKPIYIQYQ